MFQYAFSLAIKKKGFEVVYDIHTFKSEFVHDKVALQDIFPNIDINDCVKDDYIAAGKNGKISRLWKRIIPSYVTEHAYQYNGKVFSQLRKNCYVESSWQDERYFTVAEREVREAFTFAEIDDERNKKIIKDMQNSNSVAIHIRKGDGYGTWNVFTNTCPKEYYDKAIAYIREHV
ncbi:MAG: hypothetical protein Q4E61_02090, partial [Alphaproteobacteria bacterium]|nr:hypothetical protein [Alphaproteobacteria bacterium]